jgi:RNA 2',3'-cyclic 3'-phosphodiesterase
LRLFLAIPVPEPACEAIGLVQNGLNGARWSPPENLHITLRFIGDCDASVARELDDAIGAIRVAPFEVTAKGVNHFGEDQPHAMWLGVQKSAPLIALHKACERACRQIGLEAEKRTYTPHITICYLPRHQPPAPIIAYEQRHSLLSLPPWTTDRFYLYSSSMQASGPSRYRIEAEYPLIG